MPANAEYSTRHPGEDLQCPACRTILSGRVLICPGCGINLASYRDAQKLLAERWQSAIAEHAQSVEEKAQAAAAEEIKYQHQTLRVSLGVLFAGVLVIAACMISIGAINAYLRHQHQVRSQQLYQTAAACLDRRENLCARDGFLFLLDNDAHYPGAQSGLHLARYRLAIEQQSQEHWPEALAEVKLILADDPDHVLARQLQADIYTNWYTAAQRDNNQWLLLQLSIHRFLNFQ